MDPTGAGAGGGSRRGTLERKWLRPQDAPTKSPQDAPRGVLGVSWRSPAGILCVSRNILGGIPGIREKHMGVPGAPRGCPGASQSRSGASAGQLRLGVGKVPGQDKTIDRDLIPRCAHADAQFCDSPRCAHAPRRGTRAPKLTTHTQAAQPQAPPPPAGEPAPSRAFPAWARLASGTVATHFVRTLPSSADPASYKDGELASGTCQRSRYNKAIRAFQRLPSPS